MDSWQRYPGSRRSSQVLAAQLCWLHRHKRVGRGPYRGSRRCVAETGDPRVRCRPCNETVHPKGVHYSQNAWNAWHLGTGTFLRLAASTDCRPSSLCGPLVSAAVTCHTPFRRGFVLLLRADGAMLLRDRAFHHFSNLMFLAPRFVFFTPDSQGNTYH